MKPLLLLALAAAVGCAHQSSLPPSVESATVEVLVEGLRFTEGPVWLPQERALLFSDIPANRLYRWSEASGLEVFREAPAPNGNLLDMEGRLLTCRHGSRDLVRREEDGSLTVLASRYEGARFNSPNDVAMGPDGRLWFTDPPWGLPNQREGRELPFNGVFCLDPSSGVLECVQSSLSMPNGIALSPDGATLYIADTGGHPSHPEPSLREGPPWVRAFRIQPNGLDPAPIWETQTLCDGMCVDPRGWIWTTSAEGLTLLSAEGDVIGTTPLPSRPTNVCLGPEPGVLFVTARDQVYRVTVP